jgi:alpha-mannosidase
MKNKTMINFAKERLKNLLTECTDGQQLLFKRMYSNGNLSLSIYDTVDQMDDHRLDWALSQVERTIEKNNSK